MGVAHENRRKMQILRRNFTERLHGLVGLRYWRLLYLDETVALHKAALGCRAGWIDKGHHDNRCTTTAISCRQFQAQRPGAIIARKWFCLRQGLGRDMNCVVSFTSMEAHCRVAADRQTCGFTSRIARIKYLLPIQGRNDIASLDAAV
jgi:hypothetical protein